MSVYCSNKYQNLIKEIDSYKQYVNKSGWWDDIQSWWDGVPTYREMAEEKSRELQPQIVFFNNVLEALESLEKYLTSIDLMEGFRRDQNINKKYKF